MRISHLRLERSAAGARASARVTFEDAPRPPLELFFETDSRGRDDLSPEPEAFLTACALPAIRSGERRIRIEDAVCPRLAEGLATAAALLQGWYGGARDPIPIEPAAGFRAPVPRLPARAGFFFSGGIDSSHLLHVNRLQFPREHPHSFADGLLLHGNLKAESEDSPWSVRALAAVGRTAEAAGLTLLPIRTNLWELLPDLPFVTRESLSSGLAAAAHLFRRRWTRVSIATGLGVASEVPRGTHPMLDPLYSSSAVDVRHDPIRLTRLERLAELAASPPGVANLVVCLAYPAAPRLNCGECEKCVRTMTQLVAIGRLEEARSFPHRDVTPAMIRAVPVTPVDALYYGNLSEALAQRGRLDLVRALQEKLREMERLARWSVDAGWTGRLRRLDRRYLGGRLLALRRKLASP
ncbi:MAG TPA: hypothetical protein VGH97_11555 [Thermoanaerobaculia bacterium]